MSKKYTARCACGTCQFEFDTDPSFIAICHCLDCKKASGGEAAMFMGVTASDFVLTSGQPSSYGYVANSGKKLFRNFCPTCGARIFTDRLEGFPGLVFVQVGALDNPDRISPHMEMFTSRRLHWAEPLDLPQFTDMPR
jgi:hypothetical protein